MFRTERKQEGGGTGRPQTVAVVAVMPQVRAGHKDGPAIATSGGYGRPMAIVAGPPGFATCLPAGGVGRLPCSAPEHGELPPLTPTSSTGVGVTFPKKVGEAGGTDDASIALGVPRR